MAHEYGGSMIVVALGCLSCLPCLSARNCFLHLGNRELGSWRFGFVILVDLITMEAMIMVITFSPRNVVGTVQLDLVPLSMRIWHFCIEFKTKILLGLEVVVVMMMMLMMSLGDEDNPSHGIVFFSVQVFVIVVWLFRFLI